MATAKTSFSPIDQTATTVERLDFRPDLQWLRAVAVLLVFAYHLELPGFAGGYVGVDVFFVLSGYLITRLLVHELRRTGSIDLVGFALRRVRRLLPVSTVVLLATLGGMWATMGSLRRAGEALVARSTAIFGANIGLALEETDYLTAGDESALQHYWSLAVEEQFYLLWPTLLLITAVLAARLRWDRERTLRTIMVVLFVGSLLLAARWTSTSQPLAFFLLPARAWQLIAGALLAVAELGGARPTQRRVLRWTGISLLVAVSIAGTVVPFPWPLGVVPVVATAALVWAGVREGESRPSWLEERRMVWIGDRSYALYLWHWPPLVLLGLTEVAWYEQPVVRGAVVVGVFVATVATYQLVEEPLRRGDALKSRRAGFSFGAGAVVLSFVVASLVTATPSNATSATIDASGEGDVSSPDASPRDNAVVTDPGGEVRLTDKPLDVPQTIPEDLTPSLTTAVDEFPEIYANDCRAGFDMTAPPPTDVCTYGAPNGSLTVALVGDSHAAQWFDAARTAATEQGWRLLVFTKAACSLYEVHATRGGGGPYPQCPEWRTATHDRLATEGVDVVLVAGGAPPGVRASPGPWLSGARDGVARLRQSVPGAALVMLLDTPYAPDDIPLCLDEHDIHKCTFAPHEDFDARQRELAESVADTFVDTPGLLCENGRCPPIIGNVLVYRDDDHLTLEASRQLAPILVEAVAEVTREPS